MGFGQDHSRVVRTCGRDEASVAVEFAIPLHCDIFGDQRERSGCCLGSGERLPDAALERAFGIARNQRCGPHRAGDRVAGAWRNGCLGRTRAGNAHRSILHRPGTCDGGNGGGLSGGSARTGSPPRRDQVHDRQSVLSRTPIPLRARTSVAGADVASRDRPDPRCGCDAGRPSVSRHGICGGDRSRSLGVVASAVGTCACRIAA